MTDNASPGLDLHSAILLNVGLGVWQIAAECADLGWQTPQGGLPYWQSVMTPSLDLVRWTAGDKEAGARLQLCLPEWRPLLPTMETVLARAARR